jgi:hypothetical protein
MSSSVLHRALLLAGALAALAPAAGCRTTQPAQLTVLGMRPTDASVSGDDAVLFVQVVNRAHRPMRLERFSYSFGADGASGSEGDIRLSRSVEAGASVIVEVPVDLLDAPAGGGPLLLRGRLIATLDQLRQSFAVRAEVERDHATAELE